jgi:hypothetical protein
VLFRKAAALAVAGFLLPVFAYYLIREPFDPGYWSIVWHSEFTRVIVNVQPWLVYPWNAYFVFLWETFFRYPVMLLAIIAPVYLLVPCLPHKKLFIHALIISLGYLIAISIPPVKLVWYDAPVYPLLAFAIGLALAGLMNVLWDRIKSRPLADLIWTLVIAGLTCAAFLPFQQQLIRDLETHVDPEVSARALRDMVRKHDLDAIHVLVAMSDARFVHALDALRFYQKAIPLESRREVRMSYSVADVLPGECLLISNPNKMDSLAAMFALQTVDSLGFCRLVLVK